MLACHGALEQKGDSKENADQKCKTREIVDNTIRIARLKLLFISSRITDHSDAKKVKYTRHDSRVSGFFRFLEYLDKSRKQLRLWLDSNRWRCRHLSAFGMT